MKNEIELCRITNMKNITKLELEQKEKAIQELRSGIDGVKLNQQADPVQKQIFAMNKQLQEKDSIIE